MKTRKFLAILLTLAMCLGMLPGMALAAGEVAQIGNVKYETLEAAFAAAVDGDTITVLADCSGNGIQAPQGKFNTTGLTVDFNGHTYTVDGEMVGSTGTKTQAFQLLKDNKITFQNGTLYSAKAKMLVQNYSNLTLNNMTLTLNNPDYASAYTLSNNNGNIVINGTTINANPAGGFAFDVCRYASYPSVHVTVTGNSVINGDVEVSASGNSAGDGFGLTLTSGTLNGGVVIDASAAEAMDATPSLATVTKAAEFIQNVAKIGNVGYTTLEAAFAAAQDGDTITVLSNCSGNGIIAPQGKFATGLTVDFDGHTYTVDGDTVGSTGTETNGFQLLKDNTITFKDGTITSAKAKILIQNYSNLTLDNMTLTLNNPSYAYAYTLSNNNGDVVIDDTTINANPAGGFAFDVCRYSSYPSVHVTVMGSSVINGNVEVYASGSDAKDGFGLTLTSGSISGNIVVDPTAAAAMVATPDKATVTKAAAFEQDAPTGYKWNNDGKLEAVAGVAQIGSTGYATLEAALTAAHSDDTVKLLADIDYSTTNKNRNAHDYGTEQRVSLNNVTLDLNDHSITTVNASVVFDGTGTIQNGTFKLNHTNSSETQQYGSYALCIDKPKESGSTNLVLSDLVLEGGLNVWSAEVTVNNVTAETTGSRYYAVWAEDEGTVVTINSGIFTDAQSGGKGVLATGTGEEGGATITVLGGTFNASNKLVYQSETYAIQLRGGTYTKDPTAYVALGYEATNDGSVWTVGKKTVTTLAVTQKASSSADGEESSLSSADSAVVIETDNTTNTKTATITPVTVSGGVTETNAGKVTEINQDKLTEYAVANGIEKVEIVTGLSATQSVDGNAAPQTIIKDNAGKTIFEAVARGGGLRFDNKVNSSGQTYGKSGDGASKTNAIDYVDLRLQYEFKLPDGVDVKGATWYWTFKYKDNNNVEQTAIVNGTNYLPVANKTNTYTSNVLVLNVPLAHIADDFKAMLTITYELDGVTYTVSQSDATPLARVITDLAWSYSETELTKMGTAATNYITALKNVITAYMNEKSGNSGWTDTH